MAGYREFQTGEVLTAANVNNFLMEQATMTFADAAARDAALAGVLRAGLNAYLEDTDRLQYYDGTDWQNVPNESDVDAAGGLVAVKSAIFTGIQSAGVGAGGNLSVTDLTITHALADASNRLIISAFLGTAASSNISGFVGIGVDDGDGLIAVGDTDGSRTRVAAGGRVSATGTNDDFVVTMPSVTFVHAPGDTTSRTYTVRAINIRTDAQTLFINRPRTDTDSGFTPRGVSSLVIQEVKV